MDPKNITENGIFYFEHGYSCAEASLQAGAEYFERASQCTPAVAAAFGGGVQGRGHICGAFTGTLMLIGLLHGKQSLEDSKDMANKKTEEFIRFCEDNWGTLMCRDITELDFRTPDVSPAEKQQVKQKTCTPLLRSVLQWQKDNL